MSGGALVVVLSSAVFAVEGDDVEGEQAAGDAFVEVTGQFTDGFVAGEAGLTAGGHAVIQNGE